MKRTRQGAAYVGFLIALPPVLLCLGGMLTLFGILHARQATYASLHAAACRAAAGSPVTAFAPDASSWCRLRYSSVKPDTSLTGGELEEAERIGYEPPDPELRRVRCQALTMCRHLSPVPALPAPTRVRTRYSILLLAPPEQE